MSVRLFTEFGEANLAGDRPPRNLYERIRYSSKPGITMLRSRWEDYFGRYPENHKADLAARFKSPDDLQHLAAAFELFLYTFFLRQDYHIEAHWQPAGQQGDKVDFRLSKRGEEPVLIEAATVFPESASLQSDRIVNEIASTISTSVRHDVIRITIRFDCRLRTQPSVRAVVRKVETLVKEWGDALAADPDFSLPKESVIEAEGLKLTVEPHIASKQEMRSGGSVMPFWVPHGVRLSTTDTAIRNSLKAKTDKDYKRWDDPLVLAVDVIETSSLTEDDILSALFGKEVLRAHMQGGNVVRAEHLRDKNAFWHWRGQPRNKRIKAVVFFHNLGSLDLDGRAPMMYINPFIEPPYPLYSNQYISRFTPNLENCTYSQTEGESYLRLLGLETNS